MKQCHFIANFCKTSSYYLFIYLFFYDISTYHLTFIDEIQEKLIYNSKMQKEYEK